MSYDGSDGGQDMCDCKCTTEAGPGPEREIDCPIELINHGSYEFIDISSEIYREYTFVKKHGVVKLQIIRPQWLAVSKSGHRILDIDGDSHFIPKGWIHLWWKVRPGCPHFVK